MSELVKNNNDIETDHFYLMKALDKKLRSRNLSCGGHACLHQILWPPIQLLRNFSFLKNVNLYTVCQSRCFNLDDQQTDRLLLPSLELCCYHG